MQDSFQQGFKPHLLCMHGRSTRLMHRRCPTWYRTSTEIVPASNFAEIPRGTRNNTTLLPACVERSASRHIYRPVFPLGTWLTAEVLLTDPQRTSTLRAEKACNFRRSHSQSWLWLGNHPRPPIGRHWFRRDAPAITDHRYQVPPHSRPIVTWGSRPPRGVR